MPTKSMENKDMPDIAELKRKAEAINEEIEALAKQKPKDRQESIEVLTQSIVELNEQLKEVRFKDEFADLKDSMQEMHKKLDLLLKPWNRPEQEVEPPKPVRKGLFEMFAPKPNVAKVTNMDTQGVEKTPEELKAEREAFYADRRRKALFIVIAVILLSVLGLFFMLR